MAFPLSLIDDLLAFLKYFHKKYKKVIIQLNDSDLIENFKVGVSLIKATPNIKILVESKSKNSIKIFIAIKIAEKATITKNNCVLPATLVILTVLCRFPLVIYLIYSFFF